MANIGWFVDGLPNQEGALAGSCASEGTGDAVQWGGMLFITNVIDWPTRSAIEEALRLFHIHFPTLVNVRNGMRCVRRVAKVVLPLMVAPGTDME